MRGEGGGIVFWYEGSFVMNRVIGDLVHPVCIGPGDSGMETAQE